MPIDYKITTIQTVEDANHLYLEVEFYLNNKLTHTEDFIIGRTKEKRVYTGKIGPDGEILDPNAYDITPTDIKTEIQEVIIAFEKRHRGNGFLAGKVTKRVSKVKKNDTDPFDFIKRPEVQSIKNAVTRL